MTVERIGTPKEAVGRQDRNVFVSVNGQRKFRGFIQKVMGRWTYCRIVTDANVIRYIEGGALAIDCAILDLLDDYGIDAVHYHWNGEVWGILTSEVARYGVYKATGFQTRQYHVPLRRWTRLAPYKRKWVPKASEEVVREIPDEGR